MPLGFGSLFKDEKMQEWMKGVKERSTGGKPAESPASTFGQGNYLGQDFNWIRGQYRNLFEEGDPFIDEMIKTGTKRIGMSARRNKDAVENKLNQSGFAGSGANLYNALFEEEGQQIQELTNKGAQMQNQVKMQSLGQLSGMSQFEGGMKLKVDTQQEAIRQYEKTFAENVRQFGLQYALEKRKVDLAEDQASGSFWGTVGGVLGGVAGIATGGLASGLTSALGDKWFKDI